MQPNLIAILMAIIPLTGMGVIYTLVWLFCFRREVIMETADDVLRRATFSSIFGTPGTLPPEDSRPQDIELQAHHPEPFASTSP